MLVSVRHSSDTRRSRPQARTSGQPGLPQDTSIQLMQLTLIVVTLSIVLHGISVKPLMNLVWDRGRR